MTLLQDIGFKDHHYLGDGVYAAHDGFQIWLAVNRDGAEHRIALEPDVFVRLREYRQWILAKGAESPTPPEVV